ncbi:hypothetical protein H2203_005195 [Taxawa tesnikishii (nom. ined.)]|nr:hypothetical protein H2203_005195 [Dothideales sp. JES 119]
MPVLCEQSAQRSNITSRSNSTSLEITQRLGKGYVTGSRGAYAMEFLGIRYAAQPERFGYSVVFDNDAEVTSLAPAPACPQLDGTTVVGGEDCLFLNIWTPSLPDLSRPHQKKSLKAVMVWFFGSGGSSTDPTTDGGNLASRGDVVVVSFNYRIGDLGWLALNSSDARGNYGLSDMVTVLKVTIFGESSGAANVRALMASPAAKGLFSAAIMELSSGLFGANEPYIEYQTVQEKHDSIAAGVLAQVGCLNASDRLACLRNLTVGAILNATQDPGLNTVLNLTAGVVLNPSPALILASGQFASPSGPNNTLAAFNATQRVLTDLGIRCADECTAFVGAQNDRFERAYYFQFNRTYQPSTFDAYECHPAATPNRPYGDPELEYFKCHAGEVAYVFGNFVPNGLPDRDGLDISFSQLVIDYWSAFARNSGNPNPESGYLAARGYTNSSRTMSTVGAWRPVVAQASARAIRQLGTTLSDITWVDAAQCNVLNQALTLYESL